MNVCLSVTSVCLSVVSVDCFIHISVNAVVTRQWRRTQSGITTRRTLRVNTRSICGFMTASLSVWRRLVPSVKVSNRLLRIRPNMRSLLFSVIVYSLFSVVTHRLITCFCFWWSMSSVCQSVCLSVTSVWLSVVSLDCLRFWCNTSSRETHHVLLLYCTCYFPGLLVL